MGRLANMVGLLLCMSALWACSTTDISSIPDNMPCETNADCGAGFVCEGGACVAVDGDRAADGDSVADGDEAGDGDGSPDGDIVNADCTTLGGACYAQGRCGDGMRASYYAKGCQAPTPTCCLPEKETVCERAGGFCEYPLASICGIPGFSISDTKKGCDYYDAACCLPDVTCLGEGELGNMGDSCCAGLTESPAFDVAMGQCLPIPCESCFQCTRCGNGVCGVGENYCNCESDCPGPQMACRSDADCGAATCSVSDRGCEQVVPYCERGQCRMWSRDYDGSVCLGNGCQPKTCQGGDVVNQACWDGTEIEFCICTGEGEWACLSADEACPPEPDCGADQVQRYTCQDGDKVDWCTCDTKCKPVLEAGEWRDGCTHERLANQTAEGGTARCMYVGSEKEGFYDADGSLIALRECRAEWACTGTPETKCQNTMCDAFGGYCVAKSSDCPPEWEYSGQRMGCAETLAGCCLPPDPSLECGADGGFCVDADSGCPPDAEAVELGCPGEDVCCKIIWAEDECELEGGQCVDDGRPCPDHMADAPMTCANGRHCCLATELTPCVESGGLCAPVDRGCPPDTGQVDLGCGAMDVCCMPTPVTDCEAEGGMCIAGNRECPLGSYGSDLDCGPDAHCCLAGYPLCGDAGGLCYRTAGVMDCPDGFSPASGVPYVCQGETELCCFPNDADACRTSGGECIGWGPVCPEDTDTYPPVGCPDTSGACCLPTAPTRPACDSLGGYCVAWSSGCGVGSERVDADCGDLVCAGGCVCCVPR